MTSKTIVLNTGAEMPALGLGTWQSKPGEVERAVKHAIEVGYRHVDAAYCYGNENEVGEGLKAALASGKIQRKDVFVTTKLWCTYHAKVDEGLEKSLKALGLDYVDLFLMHWPVAMNPNGKCRDLTPEHSHVDTWKDMEKVFASGKAKSIGVANYSVRYLKELLPHAAIVPAVNQIENHPLLPQQDIVDFCDEKGIHITAYSPLGSSGSPLIHLPVIKEIAQKRATTPAVILLSWHTSSRRSVLAKSTTPSRIEENSHLTDLSNEDLDRIDATIRDIARSNAFTRYVYPAFGVDFGFPDKS